MLPKKETLTIEFKSDLKSLSDHELTREVVAMSNSEGGSIYIGIEDDGRVSGALAKHLDPDGVNAMIAATTTPSVSTSSEIIKEGDKSVLKVSVPMANAIIASKDGRVLKRRLKVDGTPEVVPLYPFEYSSRLSYLGNADFSSTLLRDASKEDFDEAALQHAKLIIAADPSADKLLLHLDDEEFLLSLGACRKDGDDILPTIAGIMLLGKSDSIARLLPTVSYRFQILSQSGNVEYNRDFVTNIIDAFDEFSRFCTSFQTEEEVMDGHVRTAIPLFDPSALREAFANAIVHRDYTTLAPIRVLQDDSGLTIANPGSLIHGLEYRSLIVAEARGRNPLLSDMSKRLGLCERTGRGVDRIYYGSAKYGKAWPDYSLSHAGETVLFLPKSRSDMPFHLYLAEKERLLGKSLPIFSVLILACVRGKGEANSNALEQAIGAPISKLSSYLEQLQGDGMLSAYPPYRLLELLRPQAVAPSPSGSMETFLSSRQGQAFTKEDLSSFLGIPPFKAYALIKKHVEAGDIQILHKGKYAKYIVK